MIIDKNCCLRIDTLYRVIDIVCDVIYNDGMGRKAYSPEGTVEPIKQSGGRKACLVTGFVFTCAGFALVLAALLILFIPSFAFQSGAVTPFELNTCLYGIGAGLGFVGVILVLAGNDASKILTRLSFFFGVCAFIAGFAMLIICLFFKTILPIDAINNLM